MRISTYTAPIPGLAIVLALLMPTQVLAQSRTFYGADGRVSGRSITGSNGSTTSYDAKRSRHGHARQSGNLFTTIYGADGRRVGTVTTTKPQGR